MSAISPSTSINTALSTSSLDDSSRSSPALKEDFQFSKSVSTSTISAKSSFGTSLSLDFESSKKFSDSDMLYSSSAKGSSSPLTSFQSSRVLSPSAVGSKPLSKSSVLVKSPDKSRSKLTSSSTTDFPSSPIHKFASDGNVDSLRKLMIDLDADVNLPMKDGTTPAHCAAEFGREGLLLNIFNIKQTIDRVNNMKHTYFIFHYAIQNQ